MSSLTSPHTLYHTLYHTLSSHLPALDMAYEEGRSTLDVLAESWDDSSSSDVAAAAAAAAVASGVVT